MAEREKFEGEGWFDGKVAALEGPKQHPKNGYYYMNFTIEAPGGTVCWHKAWLSPKAIGKTLEKFKALFGYEDGPHGLAAWNPIGLPVRFLMVKDDQGRYSCDALGGNSRKVDSNAFSGFLTSLSGEDFGPLPGDEPAPQQAPAMNEPDAELPF